MSFRRYLQEVFGTRRRDLSDNVTSITTRIWENNLDFEEPTFYEKMGDMFNDYYVYAYKYENDKMLVVIRKRPWFRSRQHLQDTDFYAFYDGLIVPESYSRKIVYIGELELGNYLTITEIMRECTKELT